MFLFSFLIETFKLMSTNSVAVIVTIWFLLPILITGASTNRSNSTLQFAIVVSRHGSRSPLFHFKTDPYKDPIFWPDGTGALTAQGKLEMYQLGQKLRRHYYSLIGDIYLQDEIYIRSTKVTRTYMSGAALLAGLFPPIGWQVWNPDIKWQPIPIWPDTLDKSDIVTDASLCPSFTRDRMLAISKTKGFMKEHRHLLNYVMKKSGTSIKTITDFIKIWDPLHCESVHGLKLPSWTKSIFPTKLKQIALTMFKVNECGTRKMNQLLSGPLLKDFSSWIGKKIDGSIKQKMLIHSGHDITIAGILAAVGFKDNFIIEPATALMFELYNVSTNHFIEMHYIDGAAAEEAVLMNMPKCSHPCPLSTFLKVIKESEIEGNWNEACNS